jgi:outer membrane protein assembly factor BamB
MDGEYAAIMIAEAVYKLFIMTIWFSCGWFLFYVILGPWFQVRLSCFKVQNITSHEKRIWPIFLSHLIFSVLLVNPFVLVWLAWKLGDLFNSKVVFILASIMYFLLLPVAFDLLILRLISRWNKLRWFRCMIPLKRVIPVCLLLCLIAFGAGYVSIQLQKVAPSVVRAFPLWPKSLSWKLDTNTKPLIDGSVPAETDRMFSDDQYIYIRSNSQDSTWIVADRITHKLIEHDPTTLAYVLAEDSGGTWQIRNEQEGMLCCRIGSNDPKTVPIDVSNQAIFLEHQVGDLIIGAIPSNGTLFAFDPQTGQVAWKVQAPPAKNNNDRRIGTIAGTEYVIVAGLWTSRVWTVNPKNGQQLWLFEEKGMGNAMHVEASKNGIIGFSRSGEVYSFSPTTGEIKWSKSLGDLAGGRGEGNVYVLDNKIIFRSNTMITSVHSDSGEIDWQTAFGNHYSGGLSCSKKGIVACASDRSLVLLEASSGKELLQTKFPIRSGIGYGYSNTVENEPGRIYTHPVITDNSEVYVFAGDGVLWVLKPKL